MGLETHRLSYKKEWQMTEKEFRERMKELRYSEEFIQEIVEDHKEEEKDLGKAFPYELLLKMYINKPTD